MTVTATLAKNQMQRYESVMARPILSKGVHYFEIKVDECKNGGIGVGIVRVHRKRGGSCFVDMQSDVSVSGYSFFNNGCKYNRGAIYSQKYNPFGEGDVIGVLIDMDKKCVEFMKNREPVGVVFTELPPEVCLVLSLSQAKASLLPYSSLLKPVPPQPQGAEPGV